MLARHSQCTNESALERRAPVQISLEPLGRGAHMMPGPSKTMQWGGSALLHLFGTSDYMLVLASLVF